MLNPCSHYRRKKHFKHQLGILKFALDKANRNEDGNFLEFFLQFSRENIFFSSSVSLLSKGINLASNRS